MCYSRRLHGLLLLTAGLPCPKVAELLGVDSATVQRWVRGFQHGDLEASRERSAQDAPDYWMKRNGASWTAIYAGTRVGLA